MYGEKQHAGNESGERWLAEVGEADWPHKQPLPHAMSAVVARVFEEVNGDTLFGDL